MTIPLRGTLFEMCQEYKIGLCTRLLLLYAAAIVSKSHWLLEGVLGISVWRPVYIFPYVDSASSLQQNLPPPKKNIALLLRQTALGGGDKCLLEGDWIGFQIEARSPVMFWV